VHARPVHQRCGRDVVEITGEAEIAGEFELGLATEQVPLLCHTREDLAVAGRRDRLGPPDKDAADGDLECLDPLAHRRRSDVQLLSRGVERAGVEHRRQRPERV